MVNSLFYNFLGSKEFESFSIAFFFQAIVLLMLSCIFSDPDRVEKLLIISAYTSEEQQEIIEQPVEILDQFKFDEDESEVVDDVVIQEISEPSLLVDEPDTTPQVEPIGSTGPIPISDIISDSISGVSNKLGPGVSIHSSAGGVLDRLTVEIVSNAETRELTVAWLFDSSISLSNQRQHIYDRFESILQEVDSSFHSNPINHVICSFGKEAIFLTDQPTADISKLKQNISQIIIDESGIENTFSAVGKVCKHYSKPRQRLMVIVFTDEVGEDVSLLDPVSGFARLKNCVVYAVGSPAPFGKSTTQFKFVEFDPNYESSEKWVEIQQGPETFYDMVLDLHSLPIDEETLDSGFGPFALSKLCADTGGIFFSLHPNRGNTKNSRKDISPLSSYISRFFDAEIMKDYKPDYRSVGSQLKDTTHPTKQALVKACSIPIKITGEQTLRFKAFNEGMFAEELGLAQRFSARLEPKINEVYNILLSGEPAHKSLEDERWVASYCLAMGRILATKCRIESYNFVLAEAKTGLKKKNPKTNVWVLDPSADLTSSNSVLRKNYESSQKYLHFVVEQFPGTPWALIANEELNTPFGYTWSEEYQEPPKPGNGGGGNNVPQDDKLKPKLMPKPSRKIDKI